MSVILHSLMVLKGNQGQDTRMRFSVEPFAGDSGFSQWHDAMKMCARLPGGIPPEFRRRMWLTLAEQHVRRKNIQWKEVERICFNEWASPDDEGLGDQIVKDLHRTGCSLFCGEDAEVNQALLKRVLLGYARWNKSVGYCQGFNMLAAIILEVMDKQESDALKVMIYLIEGVLPESYFANNLRGLSVDMAVFRDLMRAHLPQLSRHLQLLQDGAADQATGNCYEPPLTNVFTMQWFLTLFSNCLPKEAVMRVWDLTFLQGNEMLLRTALAIWGRLAPRIMEVPTADEFYCVMGSLTREILIHGLMDANQLVQTLVGMAPFPFPGLEALRDKYIYNITPWTQSVSSVARKGLRIFYLDDDEDDDERTEAEGDDDHQTMAVAAAFGLGGILKKSIQQSLINQDSSGGNISQITRPNLDISSLKKQYTKLRERQKQAHIVLTAQSIRKRSVHEVNKQLPSLQKTNQLTMKHLLRGKKALTSRTKRVVPQGVIPNLPLMTKKKVDRKYTDSSSLAKIKSSTISEKSYLKEALVPKRSLPDESKKLCSTSPPETLHWKDTPRKGRRSSLPCGVKLMEPVVTIIRPEDLDDFDENDGSSTSTELCDDEFQADLSEEDGLIATPIRPLSTSPRLEHHREKTADYAFPTFVESSPTLNSIEYLSSVISTEVQDLPCDLNCTINSFDKKEINTISTMTSSDDILVEQATATKEKNDKKIQVPTVLDIPTILETSSSKENSIISDTRKISLSSPTKWKWSFSEIQEPELIKPVSPILKLRNFLPDESTVLDGFSHLSPCSEVKSDHDSISDQISEQSVEVDTKERSNHFAYLFEITDVSKLSNLNSEEPSPIDDLEFKSNFKFLNFEKNPNNEYEKIDFSIKDFDSKEGDIEKDFINNLPAIHSSVSSEFPEKLNLDIASDDALISYTTPQTIKSTSDNTSVIPEVHGIDETTNDLVKSLPDPNNAGEIEINVDPLNLLLGDLQIRSLRRSTDGNIRYFDIGNGLMDRSLSYEPELATYFDRSASSSIYRESNKALNIDIDEIIKRHATSDHFSFPKHLLYNVYPKQDDCESSIITESEDFDNESIMTDITEEPCVLSESFSLDNKRSIYSLSENNLALDYTTKSGLDFISELPSYPMLNNSFKVFAKGISLDETLLNRKLPTHDINSPLDSFSSALSNKSLGSLASTSLNFTKQSANSSPEDLSLGSDISLDNLDLKKICFPSLFKSMSIDSEIQATEEPIVTEDEEDSKQQLLKVQIFTFAEDESEDSAAELIKRKLWAGVKSLSLDSELLIATNKTQKSCLDFSTSSLPTLDESPGSECSKDLKKDFLLKNIDDQEIKQKRFKKRRNSEAALQLMKENTKIIDKILNQRHGNDNIFVINNKKYELVEGEESKIYLKRRASSDQSIANSVTSIDSIVNESLLNEQILTDSEIRDHELKELYSGVAVSILKSEGDKREINFLSDELKISNDNQSDTISSDLELRKSNNILNSISDLINKKATEDSFKTDISSQNIISLTPREIPEESDAIKGPTILSLLIDKRMLNELSNMSPTDDPDKVNSCLTLKSSIEKIKSDLLKENLLTESRSKTSECNNSEQNLADLESKEFSLPEETVTYTPFLTSKYFSSILVSVSTTENKPVASFSQSYSHDHSKSNSHIENNDQKSIPPKVPFSKLSKLSPKSNQMNRQVFNPFPTRQLNRPPKEVGVKLGLYCPKK